MLKERVAIVVLGDIGRSPRMQNHAKSLDCTGRFNVDLIGYVNSKVHPKILESSNIKVHGLIEAPNFQRIFPKPLAWVARITWQAVSLFWALTFTISSPDFILVQNPPSVPSLPIVWLVCRLRCAKYILDWHNYGFTILSLATRPNSLAVKLYKWFEKTFGSRADASFAVTNALCQDLNIRFRTSRVTLLYDKPSDEFTPTSLEQVHSLLIKLSAEYPVLGSRVRNETCRTYCNPKDGSIHLKENRPALIVSSTSWTEDEDFSILLEALRQFDTHRKSLDGSPLQPPPIICIITGKGPLKEFYQRVIADFDFKHVKFILPWLEPTDYPKLLAACDFGISLHVSSSGLDLPMKILDMFGAGIPVCAYHYDSLKELVQNQVNGYTFKSSVELKDLMVKLLAPFSPANSTLSDLEYMRRNILNQYKTDRWHSNWLENALPLFDSPPRVNRSNGDDHHHLN